MVKTPFLVCGLALIALISITSCAWVNDAFYTNDRSSESPLIISGWVKVDVKAHRGYLSEYRGQLRENFDEFVGSLLDDGLAIEKVRWLKPTYGNQNLLWTLDSEIGSRRQKLLNRTRSDFSLDIYEFYEGAIDIGGHSWSYVGYKDKSEGVGADAFNMYIYVCEAGSSGVSVFYWGDGIAIQPDETQSTETLLSELASRCQ